MDEYLVWSHEHGGWWRSPSGYTPRMSEARTFSRLEALHVCADAMPGTAGRIGALPDLPVAVADLATLRNAYFRRFPEESADWM